MKGRFFLISQVFHPDEVSTAGLFTDLCIELARRGNEVEVWCAQPFYNVRKRQKNKRIFYKGVIINYLPSTNFRKESFPGKIVNMLTFTGSVILKLLLSGDKRIIFTHTTPPFLGLFISFLCSLKSRKFVYILLDIFPEGFIRLGKASRRNIIIRIWKAAFESSLRKSESIIVLGRDMMDWLNKVFPECTKKVHYIPLWHNSNISFNHDLSKNEYIINYNLSSAFIIQYSGNMGLWNNMISIGRAVNELADEVKFMFVGGGARKDELIKSIRKETLPKVLFLPFQPSEKLGSLLSACHAAIVSLGKGLEAMAVPSKIYGILASSTPVIAMVPESSEIAMIVREENCGFVIDPDDSEGLINVINYLKNNEQMRIKMGLNARRAFETKYTLDAVVSRYEGLIAKQNCSET